MIWMSRGLLFPTGWPKATFLLQVSKILPGRMTFQVIFKITIILFSSQNITIAEPDFDVKDPILHPMFGDNDDTYNKRNELKNKFHQAHNSMNHLKKHQVDQRGQTVSFALIVLSYQKMLLIDFIPGHQYHTQLHGHLIREKKGSPSTYFRRTFDVHSTVT